MSAACEEAVEDAAEAEAVVAALVLARGDAAKPVAQRHHVLQGHHVRGQIEP